MLKQSTLIMVMVYCIVGKFSFGNFAVNEKLPNKVLPMLNPACPADYLSIGYITIYALYQYFKKNTYILPRDCDIRHSSLSLGKENSCH